MSQVQDLDPQIRTRDALSLPRQADEVFAPRQVRAWSGFARFLAATFVLFVALPTLVLLFYQLFIMSPQYLVQSQFIVRGDVSRSSGSGGGGLTAAVMEANRPQEASMLPKFIPSRAFVEAVADKVNIASFFDRPEIDSWSRLAPNAAREDVAAYWSTMVAASVDAISGVVTVNVHAYSPEDALTLSKVVQEESETMLNTLLDKLRDDGLRVADQDRQRAFEELRSARQKMEDFRRQAGTLNPTSAGEDALKLILNRRSERVRVSAELRAALETLSPSAPQIKVLRARLAALDQQIAALEADLTRSGSPDALAALISTFDELDLKRQLAEQNYKRSEMTILRTRAEMERWHVYLLPVAAPDMPVEADKPRVLASVGHFLFIAVVLWVIFALLAAGTMEHRR